MLVAEREHRRVVDEPNVVVLLEEGAPAFRDRHAGIAKMKDTIRRPQTFPLEEIEHPLARVIACRVGLGRRFRHRDRRVCRCLGRRRDRVGVLVSMQQRVIETQPAFDVAVEDQLTLIQDADPAADRSHGFR